MVILHIAEINNNLYNGMNVVIPKHVEYQNKLEKVGFYNLNRILVDGLSNVQLDTMESFQVQKLTPPFNRPDLVVFQGVYNYKYIKIAKQLIRQGIPYIIVPHSQLTSGAQARKKIKKRLANFVFFNQFFNDAKAIQCLSKTELEESIDTYPPKFIATNGIELPSVMKKSFNKKKLFLYIGRLEAYQKGLDLMIEAFSRERDLMRKTSSKLEIYGPNVNGRFEFLESMIKAHKIEDFVFLHHEISGTEKRNKLLEADIFIQTSRFEGMPMGILEALSVGLPVLITEGTTLGKLVETANAGWSCPTDVQSICRKLRLILNDGFSDTDDLKMKSTNAVNLIKRDFTWDKIALDTVNKYREILLRK